MKSFLTIIITILLVVSGFSQTRNVVVGTNNAVVQPTNFWSVDAVNARSGLGLGSAATNSSSAFQPSSLVLSNVASSNALNLTNLRASNIVGTLAIINGGTGASDAATARTNLSLGWAALTNTTASGFRSAIELGWAPLTNTNVTNFRSDIGLGWAPLTNVGSSNFRRDIGLVLAALTNTNITNLRSDLGLNFFALTNTNASNFRTDIGLVLPIFTNTNSSNFLTALGVGSTNDVSFGRVKATNVLSTITISNGTTSNAFTFQDANDIPYVRTNLGLGGTDDVTFASINVTNKGITRTNLGLGAPWLTNTSSAQFKIDIGIPSGAYIVYDTNEYISGPANFIYTNPVYFGYSVTFSNAISVDSAVRGETRTNLDLVWDGLTNSDSDGFKVALGISGGITTNIRIRSLATNSSTNTNYTTNTFYYFNGILTNITTP